jgi:hypothetical protein
MSNYSVDAIIAALKKPKADPMLDPNSIEYRTAQAEKSAQETKDKVAAYNIAHGLQDGMKSVATDVPATIAETPPSDSESPRNDVIHTICEREWLAEAKEDDSGRPAFMAECIARKSAAASSYLQ